MGTSRNDSSPATPSWKAVLAVLGRTDVTVETQVREVWRAAAQDRGGALGRELGDPLFATAWDISRQSQPAQRALETYEDASLHTSNVGLAVEFGRRALARCISQPRAATSFPAELFSEAIAYYVARDLPSIVASKGRVSGVSDAVKLKSSIRDFVRARVSNFGEPNAGPDGWKSFVAGVTSALQTKKGSR